MYTDAQNDLAKAYSDWKQYPASYQATTRLNQARDAATVDFFDKYGAGGSGYQSTANNALLDAVNAQAEAAKEAARIKAATADKALQWQKDQYEDTKAAQTVAVDQARGDLNPWRQAGVDALGRLVEKITAGPGDYTKSPGYEARLAEGEKAIERSAAARGGLLSGAAVKAVTRYGQDYATNDYDNFLRRYYDSLAPDQQLAGQGANAAQQMGNYTMQGASNVANAGANTVGNMTNTAIYGGESTATGLTDMTNILAAYQAAQDEKNTAYNMFKNGEL